MGTVHHNSYTPNKSYGSFNRSHVDLDTDKRNNNLTNDNDDLDNADNDSGMSSGENEDSVRCNYNNNRNKNVSVNTEVIKCLTNENKRAVLRNEIPGCSNVKDTVIDDVLTRTSHLDKVQLNNVVENEGDRLIDSDFIVINLSCEKEDSIVGASVYNIDCDNSSILNVGSSQSLVPVANNELVKSESQKLVSLSLSILLAAILQAMRCFAQFLEDIVTPQRL